MIDEDSVSTPSKKQHFRRGGRGPSLEAELQHPGETPNEAPSDPANPKQFSSWPDGAAGGRPCSACIVITRDDGGPLRGKRKRDDQD